MGLSPVVWFAEEFKSLWTSFNQRFDSRILAGIAGIKMWLVRLIIPLDWGWRAQTIRSSSLHEKPHFKALKPKKERFANADIINSFNYQLMYCTFSHVDDIGWILILIPIVVIRTIWAFIRHFLHQQYSALPSAFWWFWRKTKWLTSAWMTLTLVQVQINSASL